MLSDHKQVTINQFLEHLDICVELGIPACAWGAVGAGKTKSIEAYAESKNYKLVDLLLAIRDSVDINGTPGQVKSKITKDGGLTWEDMLRTDWVPPLEIPLEHDHIEEDICIVFLDEFVNSPILTMSAALKMVDEGKLGLHKVNSKVRWVLASNPHTMSRAANQMIQPMQNRCKHFNIVSDADGWLDHAASAGFHPAVISFIEMNKDSVSYSLLSKDKQKDAVEENAFNTERTWEMVSKTLFLCEKKNLSYSFMLTDVAATIGSALAGVFMEFYKNNSVVPNPNDILKGKAEVRTDLDRGQTYFMINSVLATINDYVKDCVKSDLDYAKQPEYLSMVDNMVDYMDKVLTAEDISVLAMRFFTKPFSFRVPGKCNSKIYAWWELPEVKEYYGVLG